jgi:hypothetical protein
MKICNIYHQPVLLELAALPANHGMYVWISINSSDSKAVKRLATIFINLRKMLVILNIILTDYLYHSEMLQLLNGKFG